MRGLGAASPSCLTSRGFLPTERRRLFQVKWVRSVLNPFPAARQRQLEPPRRCLVLAQEGVDTACGLRKVPLCGTAVLLPVFGNLTQASRYPQLQDRCRHV